LAIKKEVSNLLRYRPWINILAGLWAIISGEWAFLLHPVNFFVLGVGIAVFGFWTYEQEWQGFINGAIGLWLVIAAFVPAAIAPASLWISGIAVICLASWRLVSVVSHQQPHLPHHPAMG